MQGEYAYFRLARNAGGGVAPRRNKKIAESAPKENGEAKRKAKKAIQETNGERQNGRKRNKDWKHGERPKREEKRRKEKEKKNKTEKGKGKRQGCPGGTMLITWVSTGGTNRDDDGHTQASVRWADRLLPPASPLATGYSRGCNRPVPLDTELAI